MPKLKTTTDYRFLATYLQLIFGRGEMRIIQLYYIMLKITNKKIVYGRGLESTSSPTARNYATVGLNVFL